MDATQIKKLAMLARLTVPDEELDSLALDIANILGFIDRIQKVDLSNTAVTSIGGVNVFRDDVVAPLAPIYDLVECAPLHQDHFVKVPKVIE